MKIGQYVIGKRADFVHLNTYMYLGIVVEVEYIVKIKVLIHNNNSYVGEIFKTFNNNDDFYFIKFE
jgi:hypothetical protein